RGHIKHSLKCTDFVCGGVGLRHALARLLQLVRHRSTGPSLPPGCSVPTVQAALWPAPTPFVPALDFGVSLYQGALPGLSTSPTGTLGPPHAPGWPSLHASPATPEGFRGAPGSEPRTAAFTQLHQARPTSTLTGECFDAACVPAWSFDPPRLDGVALAPAGEFSTGLPWRLARVGLDGILRLTDWSSSPSWALRCSSIRRARRVRGDRSPTSTHPRR